MASVSTTFKRLIADKISRVCHVPSDNIFPHVICSTRRQLGEFIVVVPSILSGKSNHGLDNDVMAKKLFSGLRADDDERGEEDIIRVNRDGIFLGFEVNRSRYTSEVVNDVLTKGENYGRTNVGNGADVMLEFSSPNIAKPFHAGHLRSTIIGNCLRNLHDFLGFHTTSLNYLGDWGKQYGLLAVGYNLFGSSEELSRDPIRHLFDVYVRVNREAKSEEIANGEYNQEKSIHELAREYFLNMERGDLASLETWRQFRSLSVAAYEKIYKRLHVQFDRFEFESISDDASVKAALNSLPIGLLVPGENGSTLANLEAKSLGTPLMVKSDGASLYLSRDMVTAERRAAYKIAEGRSIDKMIYVVGQEQELHFKQLFALFNASSSPLSDRCTHVSFGHISGMKTRTGDVVFLEDMLNIARDMATEAMHMSDKTKFKEMEDPLLTADTVGLSAIVVQDLKSRRNRGYTFDWDRMLSRKRDTGVAIQYTHARLCGIERRAAEVGVSIQLPLPVAPLIPEEAAMDAVHLLANFPNIVLQAHSQLEPSILVGYLSQLSMASSSLMKKVYVLDNDDPTVTPEVMAARLAVYKSLRQTLAIGLRLIGLPALERF